MVVGGLVGGVDAVGMVVVVARGRGGYRAGTQSADKIVTIFQLQGRTRRNRSDRARETLKFVID